MLDRGDFIFGLTLLSMIFATESLIWIPGLMLTVYFMFFMKDEQMVHKKNFSKDVFYIKANNRFLMFNLRFKDLFKEHSDIEYLGFFEGHPNYPFLNTDDEYFLFKRKPNSKLSDKEIQLKLLFLINNYDFWVLDVDKNLHLYPITKCFGAGRLFFSELEAKIAKLELIQWSLDQPNLSESLIYELESLEKKLVWVKKV